MTDRFMDRFGKTPAVLRALVFGALVTLAACSQEDQDKAAEQVVSTADKAKEAAEQAVDSAKEAVSKATDAVKESAAGMGDKAKDMAEKAAETVTETAESAAERAKESTAGVTEKAKEMADTATEKAGAAATAVAAAAAGATGTSAAGDADAIKAAWVYIGPVGDGGWTFAHDNGRKAAQEAMGDKMVSSFVESVPESADAERVLRDLAVQGNQVIFGTTFGYMESMRKLAKEFPDVRWEHATGYKTAENMRTYDSRTYQGAYMAGVIAGAMTKSNTLGVVGSIPIPEVIRNINSFTMGAQSMNPDISTKVVWVNKWFDPPREAEAAQSLLDQGADVLFQNTDSSAVLQTAQKAGKFAFGWDSDMTAYGPEAHLASAIINWGPYYTQAMTQVAEGTWETGTSWWGVAEGAIDIVSVSDKVPAEVKAKVDGIRAGLKGGIFKIWKGPLMDSAGKEVLADGVVADDKFLSGVNFYVKGVEGQVPTGG